MTPIAEVSWAFGISDPDVAILCRKTLQAEYCFKWLKTHLGSGMSWRISENAARMLAGAAIPAYCLMNIVLKDHGDKWFHV